MSHRFLFGSILLGYAGGPLGNAREHLAEILKTGFPAESDFAEGLARTGRLIDAAYDCADEAGAEVALEWTELLLAREGTAGEHAELHYFIGNAWSVLQAIRSAGKDSSWGWEVLEIEKQVLHHRTALRLADTADVDPYRRCQMHTNLGNVLSNVGRFVDAIDEWDAALALDPNFAMATANRGKGLYHYSCELYDSGHQAVFVARAAAALQQALAGTLEEGAQAPLERLLEQAERMCRENGIDRDFDLDAFSLGESDEEVAYRTWCLQQRLFLNPLNDVGPHAVAANDVLLLPSLTLPFGKPPSLIGFYNQLKQEFASARFLLYEALRGDEPHFSDRGVKLINTLDYPAYGLAVEKAKAAFRTVYSVLDKIAFFLNDYLQLEIPGHKTKLRTVWYAKGSRKRGVRDEFSSRRNWPLRGLYWLTKDLSEDRGEFLEAMSPEAREVAEIRNQLEHKYLKLHGDLWSPGSRDLDQELGVSMEELAHSVARSDFERKAMSLMKLTRAALIYLSLGVHSEERKKKCGRDAITAPILTDTWNDESKL